MWQGTLLSIHTAVEGRAPMEAHDCIKLIEGLGLEGDRYATGKGKYSEFPDIREVTLIENETLVALERDKAGFRCGRANDRSHGSKI